MRAAMVELAWTWLRWQSDSALASDGADGWRCLSLSWRAPMREPEEKKLPIGLPLSDITVDQFMDIENSWSMREDRV